MSSRLPASSGALLVAIECPASDDMEAATAPVPSSRQPAPPPGPNPHGASLPCCKSRWRRPDSHFLASLLTELRRKAPMCSGLPDLDLDLERRKHGGRRRKVKAAMGKRRGLVLVDGEETLLGLLPRVAEEEEEKLALGQRAGCAA
ncbi:hypothetical protein E2562_035299 [Oryza meyeriana var. granulata]|uniref:Uncharacterized protein n=1 Tax=Oryza meyeriana var. granulata TaxID=110450 RepID=A0A6G1CKV5_9ORYZ|nr:hypothetical protein E2562_035299 [Oryza meyeriana var. granulata]